MSTLGDRLRQLRTMEGMTQKDVSMILGVCSQTVSQYELNKRTPDVSGLLRLCDYYNVSLEYLLAKSDYTIRVLSTKDLTLLNENRSRRIPVFKTIADALRENVPATKEVIEIPKTWTGEYCAFKMQDDSMSPVICKDDTVCVQKQSKAITHDLIVVSIDNKTPVVRKLERKNKKIFLHPLNPAFSSLIIEKDSASRMQILGKVLECRHRF